VFPWLYNFLPLYVGCVWVLSLSFRKYERWAFFACHCLLFLPVIVPRSRFVYSWNRCLILHVVSSPNFFFVA
jgi:hypothetical protein